MRRQFRPRRVQSAQVDDAAHPRLAGGRDDVLGRATLLRGEILFEPHRVHQVVDDVDTAHRLVEAGAVERHLGVLPLDLLTFPDDDLRQALIDQTAMILPPGEHVLDLNGERRSITLHARETLRLETCPRP